MYGKRMVALSWEVEDGVELPLRVYFKRHNRIAAVKASFNEPGAPAEGGEIEDVHIYSGARLAPALENRLIADDRFMTKVEEMAWGGLCS